jgi:hypothetical protein
MSARRLSFSFAAALAASVVLSAAEATAASGAPAATQSVAALIPRPPASGRFFRAKSPVRPVAIAQVKPKPAPSPAPKATPAAKATPAPQPTPTPRPVASPSPAPVPDAAGAPPMAASAEGTLSTWALPGATGQGYDLSFTRPTWSAEGALWWGDWGLGGAATAFGTTYASFQTTPYFEANTWMVDALIKRRFSDGRGQAFAGYRGIGLADVNFAILGATWKHPLTSDWLFALAHAQAGHSFSGSYVLDGRVALQVFLDPLILDLGFRHLALQAGARPLLQVNGPVAGIGLRF